jgi:putative addiction module CopG family antidote
MTITLSPKLESFVVKQVGEGAYADADAVLLDAAMALEERQERERKLSVLKAAIAESDADIEEGRFSNRTAHEILAEIRTRKVSLGAGA